MTALDKDLQALQDVRDLIARAREAKKALLRMSQADVDRICKAMVAAGARESEALARLAVEESGFGVVASKIYKNYVGTELLWEHIKGLKTVGVIHRDEAAGVIEIAYPAGVIGALIPITNPTSTTMFKIISAVKARCPIVVSPHPRGIRCTGESSRILYEAGRRAGAPEGFIGCMQLITMEAANYMMRNVDLILATGGTDLVKAAYSAGRPALGVGPGNPPAYIHPSADLAHAVKAVVMSQCFDNGTICASEQSIVTEQSVREQVLHELALHGAHICSAEEIAKLERIMLQGRRQNPDLVGQYPRVIAKMAGFTVPHDTTVLICEQSGKGVGFQHPLSIEKLAPILAFYSEIDTGSAKERCRALLEFGGDGHTLAIHARDERIVSDFAEDLPAFRIVVNGPTSQGAVGYSTNLSPSMTLGCGTPGHNITSDNIGPLNLINVKRVAITRPGFVADGTLRSRKPETGVGYREQPDSRPKEAPRTTRYGHTTSLFDEVAPLSKAEVDRIIAQAMDPR